MATYHAFVSYSHAADRRSRPRCGWRCTSSPSPGTRRARSPSSSIRAASRPTPLCGRPSSRPCRAPSTSSSWASPESAASPWVRKEIEWWLRNRSVDSMLVLLTGGELARERGAGDFDWTSNDRGLARAGRQLSGRAALRRPAIRKGRRHVQPARPQVSRPRCWTSPRRCTDGTRTSSTAKTSVQNRRTMRIARGVAVAMAVLAGAAVWQAIVANQERREAELQRNEAITQRGVAERGEPRGGDNQKGIANGATGRLPNKQTIEAQRQKTIAIEQRDEAVRQRDLALSRRLVSDSSRQLVNPLQWDLAMLLAIESLRKAPTADNYELLAALSRAAHDRRRFPANAVAVQPRQPMGGDHGKGDLSSASARRTRARADGRDQHRASGTSVSRQQPTAWWDTAKRRCSSTSPPNAPSPPVRYRARRSWSMRAELPVSHGGPWRTRARPSTWTPMPSPAASRLPPGGPFAAASNEG